MKSTSKKLGWQKWRVFPISRHNNYQSHKKEINLGSPLFRVDIITKTNAGKLKKHLIHKE
jgi:hypothetical protein